MLITAFVDEGTGDGKDKHYVVLIRAETKHHSSADDIFGRRTEIKYHTKY